MSADILRDHNAAGKDEGVWVVRPHRGTIFGYLGETWRYRRLFPLLIKYSLSNVYKSSVLGIGWLFIRPIMSALMATLFLKTVLGVSTGPVPYLLFILLSMSFWSMFQRSLTWGTKSIQRNGRLSRHFYFPKIIAHVTAIAPVFIEFGIILFSAVLAGIYFYVTGHFRPDFGLHILAAPLAIVMLLLFVIGLTCVTSPLNSAARDVWYVMRYLMGPLIFITPVYYPRTALPEPWKEYMLFNPLTPILELYRWAFFHSEPMRWDALALSAVVILVMLLLGLLFFIKWEPKVLDRA